MKKLPIIFLTGLLSIACQPKAETTTPEDASSHEAHHPESDGQAEPEAAAGEHEGMAHACPMKVPNTTVGVKDVEGGVALEFETDGDGVADLRERVRKMAAMHTKHHGEAASSGEGGMHHGGTHQGKRGEMNVPASTAVAEDVETGARLVFQPTDPAQLQALRDHMSQMAMKMQSGQCPMMEHHG